MVEPCLRVENVPDLIIIIIIHYVPKNVKHLPTEKRDASLLCRDLFKPNLLLISFPICDASSTSSSNVDFGMCKLPTANPTKHTARHCCCICAANASPFNTLQFAYLSPKRNTREYIKIFHPHVFVELRRVFAEFEPRRLS